MQPRLGTTVYYKARGSADGKFPKVDRAAIVTDVRRQDITDSTEGPIQVRVCVLNPEGIFFSNWLDRGQEGGQWDFIPELA